MTSITTRPKTLSSSQISSYLLNHESCLAHQTHSLLSASPISTNSTTTQSQSSSSSSNQGHGRGSSHGRGTGRGPPSHPTFLTQSSAPRPTRSIINLATRPCHATIALIKPINPLLPLLFKPTTQSSLTPIPPLKTIFQIL